MEQVQVLPVKTALDLQKRYLVFINRDKVSSLLSVYLWNMALCIMSSK